MQIPWNYQIKWCIFNCNFMQERLYSFEEQRGKQQIQYAQLIIVKNAITQQFDTSKAHFYCWRTSQYGGEDFFTLIIINYCVLILLFRIDNKTSNVFQPHWLNVYIAHKVPCFWMYCKNIQKTQSKNHKLYMNWWNIF